MDDSIVWDDDMKNLETRIAQLSEVFAEWGLELNAEKTQWYLSPHSTYKGKLRVKGIDVEPVEYLEVMGLKLTVTMTSSEMIAPLMAKARDAVWSLKHLLLRKGKVKKRLQILQTVVGGAGLWCIAALPPDKQALELVNKVQNQFLVWMMKRGRHAEESWVQHHIRVHREARSMLAYHGYKRWSTIWLQRQWGYAGHRARCMTRQTPLASAILDGWRDRQWWDREKSLSGGARHPGRFHAKLMPMEKVMDEAAGDVWKRVAMSRRVWKSRESNFVALVDVPWTSGRQSMLEM